MATRCLRCGYDLRGTAADGRCPECGYGVRLSASGVAQHQRLRNVLSAPLSLGAVAYTLYGFNVFVAAGMNEPFYRHADWPHLVFYVIAPTAALVVSLQAVVATLYLCATRVLRRWCVLLLLWTSFVSLLLFMGIESYVRDIIEM